MLYVCVQTVTNAPVDLVSTAVHVSTVTTCTRAFVHDVHRPSPALTAKTVRYVILPALCQCYFRQVGKMVTCRHVTYTSVLSLMVTSMSVLVLLGRKRTLAASGAAVW